MKQVSVLVGAGSIGQAIVRRVRQASTLCWQTIPPEDAERAKMTLTTH